MYCCLQPAVLLHPDSAYGRTATGCSGMDTHLFQLVRYNRAPVKRPTYMATLKRPTYIAPVKAGDVFSHRAVMGMRLSATRRACD